MNNLYWQQKSKTKYHPPFLGDVFNVLHIGFATIIGHGRTPRHCVMPAINWSWFHPFIISIWKMGIPFGKIWFGIRGNTSRHPLSVKYFTWEVSYCIMNTSVGIRTGCVLGHAEFDNPSSGYDTCEKWLGGSMLTPSQHEGVINDALKVSPWAAQLVGSSVDCFVSSMDAAELLFWLKRQKYFTGWVSLEGELMLLLYIRSSGITIRKFSGKGWIGSSGYLGFMLLSLRSPRESMSL